MKSAMYVLFAFALAMLVVASRAGDVSLPAPVTTKALVDKALTQAPLPPKRPVAHKHPVAAKKHVHRKHQ